MKTLRALTILSVLLTALSAFAAGELTHIFKIYSNKTTVLGFKQTSINAMSGQSITRDGKLIIQAKKSMIFDYKKERVIINDFEAVDYNNGKKYVYKLSGFNKVLFLLFLGREKIDKLFKVEKQGDRYILLPKYKSSIDRVYACFDNKSRIDNLTIIDIYSNKTIYNFYAAFNKRTQIGN